jgi:hypothetical protein
MLTVHKIAYLSFSSGMRLRNSGGFVHNFSVAKGLFHILKNTCFLHNFYPQLGRAHLKRFDLADHISLQ